MSVLVAGLGLVLAAGAWWRSWVQLEHELASLKSELAAPSAPEGGFRLQLWKDVLQAEAVARGGPVQLFAIVLQTATGAALFAGLWLTARNLHVAQEGQIADRFTKAIEQLGSGRDGGPNLEVRVGAIFALERIAKDSGRDYWPIMEVLTTYVRETAPWPPSATTAASQFPQVRPRADVQAALTVIGRRRARYRQGEEYALDLHGADLRGAALHYLHFEAARLYGSNLSNAHLVGSDLQGAWLYEADLAGADLTGADLRSVVDLTAEQLLRARMDATTRLPSFSAAAAPRGTKTQAP